MDILKELKDLVINDGLKTWIENFRNPENEPFSNTLLCEIRYDPKTDSRIYNYEEEHPAYYDHAFEGGSKIVPIDIAFENYLNARLIAFEKEKEDLMFLVIDDLPLFREFASRAADFTMLRNETKKISPLASLTDLLIIHIGKVEEVYRDFIERATLKFKAPIKKVSASKAVNSKKLVPSEIKKGLSNKTKTFELLNVNFRINTLHSNLIAAPSLIDELPLNDFKKLFTNECEVLKINWKGQVNQLSYLIRRLIEANIINNYGAWETAIKYFTVKGKIVPNLKASDDISLKSKKEIDSRLPPQPLQNK